MTNYFPEDKEFINSVKKTLDALSSRVYLSDFLNPWEISLTRHALAGSNRKIDEWGGYDAASRKRIVASAHNIKQSMFRITPIEFKPNSMINYPNRKSVISRFSNKNVPLESIGDIIHSGDRYYIMLDSEHGNIIVEDANITLGIKLPSNLQAKDKKEMSSTVASTRLDSICSTAYKPSRSKLKGLIENGGAMIDYSFIYKGGKEVAEGSVISLRGFPRVQLTEIGDVSKKGRTRIKIKFID